MKIVKASEMARIEALSYAEGAKEEDFMRAAGAALVTAVRKMVGRLHKEPKILFLCGKGNNGGDGYAAAKILLKGGFAIQVVALSSLEESSPLAQKMRKEFVKGKGNLLEIRSASEIDVSSYNLIVDALWGTGFKGELPPLYCEVIKKVNQSNLLTLAVDIPSGINGTTGERGEVAIKATRTLFLGLPKTGCFLGDVYNYVGEVSVAGFGLDKAYVKQAAADFILVEESYIRSLLPPLVRTRHKYEAGYVVGVGGSASMPGAPLLACEAALRSGAGLVRLFHPDSMNSSGFGSLTIMRHPYAEDERDALVQQFARAAALFLGPGMGVDESARNLLRELLPKITTPCVIDADALTIIAEEALPLPKETILTPHKGELKRLLRLGEKEISPIELLEMTKEYAAQHQITIVFKGAPTFIFHKETTPYLIAHGDPGMATAGSGDVLTGMVASFLAQTKNTETAALLGCYFHARAGEYAAKEETPYAMTAMEIIKYLPHIFKIII
jgi:NAD(P)H-hydrate epimerase